MKTDPKERERIYDKVHAGLDAAQKALKDGDAHLLLTDRLFLVRVLRLSVLAAKRGGFKRRADAKTAKVWRDAWKPKGKRSRKP
jgi:hypothetical protein